MTKSANTITIERCRCGHKCCQDYWLVGLGKFVQGSGFEKDDAERIARLLNDEAAPATFQYFENQEGGMAEYDVQLEGHLRHLYGWMQPDCRAADRALVKWMGTARIGERFEHRLGTCVRVRPA
jgi:hypothetical protein